MPRFPIYAVLVVTWLVIGLVMLLVGGSLFYLFHGQCNLTLLTNECEPAQLVYLGLLERIPANTINLYLFVVPLLLLAFGVAALFTAVQLAYLALYHEQPGQAALGIGMAVLFILLLLAALALLLGEVQPRVAEARVAFCVDDPNAVEFCGQLPSNPDHPFHAFINLDITSASSALLLLIAWVAGWTLPLFSEPLMPPRSVQKHIRKQEGKLMCEHCGRISTTREPPTCVLCRRDIAPEVTAWIEDYSRDADVLMTGNETFSLNVTIMPPHNVPVRTPHLEIIFGDLLAYLESRVDDSAWQMIQPTGSRGKIAFEKADSVAEAETLHVLFRVRQDDLNRQRALRVRNPIAVITRHSVTVAELTGTPVEVPLTLQREKRWAERQRDKFQRWVGRRSVAAQQWVSDQQPRAKIITGLRAAGRWLRPRLQTGWRRLAQWLRTTITALKNRYFPPDEE